MGAELVGRGEPEIHLETGWQQKRPVDRGRDLELEVVQGSKFAVEVVGPIGEDRIQRDIIGDAEVQVDVGPSILSAVRPEPVSAAPVMRGSFSASPSSCRRNASR